MEKINLHIFPNNFQHRSRVLRETKSIVELGLADKVYIAGLWELGLKKIEYLDRKRFVWHVPLKTRPLSKKLVTQLIKYIEFITRIILRFRKENIVYVNCHDLSALPIGLVFKILNKSKLIFDPHELETEAAGLTGLRKHLSKILEKTLIHFVDRVIVVSDSIREWYKGTYRLNNVYVVKNVPSKGNVKNVRSTLLRDKFRIKKDDILYIYQGGLVDNRGIRIILDAFSRIGKKKHVVFMGYGIYEYLVKEYEKEFQNIHFQPAVPPSEVLYYTSSADIGISLIENVCLSYYYCMPNKVFEYYLSAIPMIVSDFPEMGRFIDENNCGWKISVSAEELAKIVKQITLDDIHKKRKSICRNPNKYSWESEEKVLCKVYRSL